MILTRAFGLTLRDHSGILSDKGGLFGLIRYLGRVHRIVLLCFSMRGVWAHHMFHVFGMSSYAKQLFHYPPRWRSGVPTGIKIFNWTRKPCGAAAPVKDPLLFARASSSVPDCRPAGIMLAASPFTGKAEHVALRGRDFIYVMSEGLLFRDLRGLY